ncbi:MAG: uracil-DNA glycosylase family protein [Treponema sp.]|nr:uracil-DNA glycosylase family protein [Treponema sp.]
MITVAHPLDAVWNSESRILILGTMPSPASRAAGFYYMHGQNRFWRVLARVFGEELTFTNKGFRTDKESGNANGMLKKAHERPALAAAPDLESAILERRDLLLRHKIALWDVLASCNIKGAADASIKNAIPNNFTRIFTESCIRQVFCTGKTAFSLWQKHCAPLYESDFGITSFCLPSTSPANAVWSLERLVEAYQVLR